MLNPCHIYMVRRPDLSPSPPAHPPAGQAHHRQAFLKRLGSSALRLAVEESSVRSCEAATLDNEMSGGLAPSAQSVPVQFIVLRSSLGNSTVGLKAL